MTVSPLLTEGMENVENAWGITFTFPKGTPGILPCTYAGQIVVKDIEHWRDYVHAPSLDFSQELWDQFKAMYDAVDSETALRRHL